jgi:uncharacterized SAM-binding protein YcdF (DUF218 family)
MVFFVTSKLVGVIIEPANFLAILILAGLLLTFLRYPRLARLCLIMAAAMVVFLGVLPGGVWLTLPLERRFPVNPPLPDRVAGIIALGGTERVENSVAWGQPALSDPAPIAALLALGRRYPEAKLVFSGGSGLLHGAPVSEGEVVRRFLDWMGVDRSRLIYEERSRNTHENAVLSRELLKPEPGERWILICGGLSMPRAVGVFRQLGWDVIPYPAGFVTNGEPEGVISLNLLDGLGLASFAVHEWVGLLVYRLVGYTDALFPG